MKLAVKETAKRNTLRTSKKENTFLRWGVCRKRNP